MNIIGHILLVISGLFYALGGLGLVRMPDVYTRAQAGTKATTLGTFSALIAVCFYFPAWAPKLLLILVFVAITNPVGSSTILRSAYRSGLKPGNLQVDALEDLYKEEA
jgi:multicomponent Na+:H+ antiporter subunit G